MKFSIRYNIDKNTKDMIALTKDDALFIEQLIEQNGKYIKILYTTR